MSNTNTTTTSDAFVFRQLEASAAMLGSTVKLARDAQGYQAYQQSELPVWQRRAAITWAHPVDAPLTLVVISQRE